MTDMTIFTKQLRRFFEDASAAGYQVAFQEQRHIVDEEPKVVHTIDIYKKHDKQIDVGIRVNTVDGRFGSAYRIDVDPNLALNIETIKRCRKILGI